MTHVLRKPSWATNLDSYLDTVGWGGMARAGAAWACYCLGTQRCWTTPEIIRFEVSSICNLKCVMCPQPHKMTRPKQILDFDLYRRVLDANPRVKQVSLFNWGEPLLHPRITDFIAYADSRGIATRLYSNATLLDREMTHKLVMAGLRYMNFSVDNFGEAYQAIRGVPFERVWNNIAYFTQYAAELAPQLEIGLAITLFSDNKEQSQELVRAARELGIHRITLTPSETFDETRRRKGPCFEPYRYLVVLSNGKVVPCCSDYDARLAFGSVYDELDLSKLYNSNVIQRLRRNLRRTSTMPKFCSHCTYRTKAA